MTNNRTYTFGELRHMIHESANEFAPKFGNNYSNSKEKSENEKAYSEIAKGVQKFNVGAQGPQLKNKGASQLAQVNLGMSDLQFDGPVSQSYKERMKANLKGYTSPQEEKNHAKEVRGNAQFDDAIAQENEKHAADVKAMQDAYSEVGITNNQKKKEDTHRHTTNMSENKKIDTLKFKKVQFISESQMLVHVPDEYKRTGKQFYMQDCKGNKYLVEWHKEPIVDKLLNEEKTTAEMERIKYLFNYSSKPSKTTNALRMNENKEVDNMLNRVRQLMK